MTPDMYITMSHPQLKQHNVPCTAQNMHTAAGHYLPGLKLNLAKAHIALAMF